MQAENVTTSDQIVKLNKDISDIKNILSTYSDYFKDHFSQGPGGTKNDEFKTPPSPFQPEVSPLNKLSDEDIIYHIKSSDSWIYLKAMLEMDYTNMNLLNLFCWVHGVCKYASTLFGVINVYKSMQTDVEEYDDFYGDSFE
jgi:hypothetical protein